MTIIKRGLKMTATIKFAAYATGLILLALMIGCASVSIRQQSSAQLTYDFESGVPGEWSRNRVCKINDNTVLGLFNNRNKKFAPETSLRLSDIPKGSQIDLSFDLYLIGTWDSSGKLADRWQLSIQNGDVLLDLRSFPNGFKDPEEKIPDGNAGFVNVCYHPRAYWIVNHQVSILPEQITEDALTLVFKGYLTGRKTEFWALDNVKLTIGS